MKKLVLLAALTCAPAFAQDHKPLWSDTWVGMPYADFKAAHPKLHFMLTADCRAIITPYLTNAILNKIDIIVPFQSGSCTTTALEGLTAKYGKPTESREETRGLAWRETIVHRTFESGDLVIEYVGTGPAGIPPDQATITYRYRSNEAASKL